VQAIFGRPPILGPAPRPEVSSVHPRVFADGARPGRFILVCTLESGFGTEEGEEDVLQDPGIFAETTETVGAPSLAEGDVNAQGLALILQLLPGNPQALDQRASLPDHPGVVGGNPHVSQWPMTKSGGGGARDPRQSDGTPSGDWSSRRPRDWSLVISSRYRPSGSSATFAGWVGTRDRTSSRIRSGSIPSASPSNERMSR